jgi:ubiquinone/menaquinone biosynthesis methyltransferase
MQQRAMFRNMKNEKKQTENTTHFGSRTVDENAKQGLVRNVFDSVADKYDIMNDVMSGGLHRVWKNELIKLMRPTAGQHLFDVAGGTGDIAFRFLEEANKNLSTDQDPAFVTLCDINNSMLTVGRDRAIDLGITANIDWVCGNAETLPLPDQSVDLYTISFGIRNVTHIDIALKEARRVLKPGGRFICLEFSHVEVPVLDKIYDLYSEHAIPTFGSMITGDRESYQYLIESIRNFPSKDKFKAMIEEAGFKQVTYRSMTAGVVALHSGWAY